MVRSQVRHEGCSTQGKQLALPAHTIKGERRILKAFAVRLMTDDSGQDLIEYALLAGFISLVAVAAIINVGTGVNDVYDAIDS